MVDTLAHRGPDGRGEWVSPDGRTLFGHRRLSIIGPDERGAQPFHSDALDLTITFNGEIYNYPELRVELEARGYRFVSDTDTEVILYAYDAWGLECLNRFNGIFAFGLFDGRRDRIVLARDHVGVKPLAYWEGPDGGLVFASEAKAILAHPAVKSAPCLAAIRSTWVHHLWQDNRMTWFEGIRNLEPGSYMVIDRNSRRREGYTYWELVPRVGVEAGSYDHMAERFRELLTDAVRLQTRSDVGFSTTNSGGLDSSAITAIAAGMHPRVDAFTVRYEFDDALPPQGGPSPDFKTGISRSSVDLWHARLLADSLDNVDLTEVQVRESCFSPHLIDACIYGLEQMPYDTRIMALYRLYEDIHDAGHKVTLIGQGPDEVWLGYYYDDAFWRYRPEQVSREYLAREHFPSDLPFAWDAWNGDFMSPELARASSAENLSHHMAGFASGDPLNDLCALGQRTILQSILLTEDRMSMCHSVEARVPWVDYRLMELAFEVPSYVKIDSPDDNHAKYFNRQALRGIVPDAIIDRRKSPLPHPPESYRDRVVRDLVQQSLPEMQRSELVTSVFRREFVDNAHTSGLSMRQLFTMYSLWRFEAVFFGS